MAAMNVYPAGTQVILSCKFYDKTQTPAVLYQPGGAIVLTYDITTDKGIKSGPFTATSSWNSSASSQDSSAIDSTGSSGTWTYRAVAGPGAGQTASLDNALYTQATGVT